MGISRLALLGVALAAAAGPLRAGAEGLSLHVIPTSVARGARLEAGAPLRVAAFLERPDALAATLRTGVVRVASDHLDLDLAEYPQLEPTAPEGFLASSWVVDFEAPAVRALHAELVERYGPAASADELRRFTRASIPEKSMARGWDLASRVAASGQGDCTEHAVLLAALARAAGHPARVALGLLIVVLDGEAQAFGHAWTELHDGARWLPVDATPAADGADALGYLPVMLLADEGPGYALPVARALQQTWVKRVAVLGTRAR